MATRTDAQLLAVIHTGKGSMPAWGTRLTEEQITAVLAHIRALGRTP
jgi:mono/diheme cytochrome c family protein